MPTLAGIDRMRVYVDESGQTGEDVLDERQPIYAVAGIWANDETEERLADLAAAVRERYRLQSPELSGWGILRRRDGVAILRDITRGCAELGLQVALVGWNKSFLVAGAIIEEYTDHNFNPMFPPETLFDPRMKEPLADFLHDRLPESSLRDWWHAYREGDAPRLLFAHQRLIRMLRLVSDAGELADVLEHVDIAGVARSGGSSQEEGRYSPNVSAHVALLEMVDRMAVDLGVRFVQVVHDTQSQYELEYQQAFTLLTTGPPREFPLNNGNSARRGLAHITGLEFRSSARCVPIQLADCLAAVARLELECTVRPSDRPAPAFQAELRLLYSCAGSGAVPYVIGPLRWQARGLAALKGSH